jgi:hypothetical protein
MKGMKEPLILLFTHDGDFAQSVREAVSETGVINQSSPNESEIL